MNASRHALAIALAAILGIPAHAAHAQAIPAMDMPAVSRPAMSRPAMDMPTMPAIDPDCPPEHAAMGHCTPKPAATPAAAVDPACPPEHAAMGHCVPKPSTSQPTSVDPACPPEHAAMGHCVPKPSASQPASVNPACPPEHAAMGHCVPNPGATLPPTLPRTPIPPPTDADRAAAFPVLSHGAMVHGAATRHYVLLDRLEAWNAGPGRGQAWEGSAWIGGDIDRLWLRSEGERVRGRLAAADLEALYGHAAGPWWDALVGVRLDDGPGGMPSRQWAAFGVQGLAPYKFEVSATAYLGSGGRTAARFETDYDVLLSNRLILQPRVEAWWHGRTDPATRTGAGLSSVEAGLRLRYEITRRFAPYLGVVHARRFGDSAGLARGDGERARDTRWVAGVRVWF